MPAGIGVFADQPPMPLSQVSPPSGDCASESSVAYHRPPPWSQKNHSALPATSGEARGAKLAPPSRLRCSPRKGVPAKTTSASAGDTVIACVHSVKLPPDGSKLAPPSVLLSTPSKVPT